MGLGVLDDSHLDHVPGTSLLIDLISTGRQNHGEHGEHDDVGDLRHAKGRDSDVVLVPQPSSSPNDPLNWPLWKKDFMLFLICIDTAVVGAWVWHPRSFMTVFNPSSRLGPNDLACVCHHEQAVRYVLQCRQWRSRLGHLYDRRVVLFYPVYGGCLGPSASVPTRQSAALRQQHLGLFCEFILFSSRLTTGGMHRDVSL